MGYFKGKQFKEDIILVAVGYYCLFVPSAGFQNLRHISRPIRRIETIQVIYKQRRNLQIDFAFSVSNELQKLIATA
nr:hypothetical protein GGBNIMDK_00116 [Bacillus cereus]